MLSQIQINECLPEMHLIGKVIKFNYKQNRQSCQHQMVDSIRIKSDFISLIGRTKMFQNNVGSSLLQASALMEIMTAFWGDVLTI
jgi:hypothetical protein